ERVEDDANRRAAGLAGAGRPRREGGVGEVLNPPRAATVRERHGLPLPHGRGPGRGRSGGHCGFGSGPTRVLRYSGFVWSARPSIGAASFFAPGCGRGRTSHTTTVWFARRLSRSPV